MHQRITINSNEKNMQHVAPLPCRRYYTHIHNTAIQEYTIKTTV